MADINAEDLTQETLSSLDGSEQFVMFDNVEGKRTTLQTVKMYVSQGNHLLPIDTSAASGSVDGNLYAEINSFGWASDVISS